MEAISGAASISQLLVYSLSSVHFLRKLSSELSQGKSVYHEEERNIRSLLDIVSRLSLPNEIGACDPVLPILVDICRLAYDILLYLQPKVVWGINLTPLINRDRIISSLALLDTKRELLHLHIAQANSDVLSSLQSGNKGSCCNPKMSGQTCKVIVNKNDVQGIFQTLDGIPGANISSITEISVSENIIAPGAAQLTANATQHSSEDVIKMLQANVELEKTRFQVKAAELAAKRRDGTNTTLASSTITCAVVSAQTSESTCDRS
ncbi:hypothetical protein J1614_002373 [Plenodomus biglobosus]|nr:hypothetical protein J1614_002373 [Plenodomus biglobosus]